MRFSDKVQYFISNDQVKEESKNIVEDVVNAILGDPVSAGKVMIAFAKMPFFIREQLFWTKLSAFLDGVYLSDEDRSKLRAKLVENGMKKDNPLRLVDCIDHAETMQKIRYLINATRCLLADYIDQPEYFRICHAVTHTLDEDLQFLAEHIMEKDLEYDSCVQGLVTSGLMYQSVITAGGEQKYSFTPIAEKVDRFAVSYENVERYPNPQITAAENQKIQVSLPSTNTWQTITDEEIEDMFNV